jgi:carboxyl-terminal processing protease
MTHRRVLALCALLGAACALDRRPAHTEPSGQPVPAAAATSAALTAPAVGRSAATPATPVAPVSAPRRAGLGWRAAFAKLCATLAREYPFSAWKGLDWAALERDLGPRVASAEQSGDRCAYYRAVRELVWRLRDGHARLLGDDCGLARAEIGGAFGLEVIELDDRRLLASRVAPAGPAARAGLRFGAEIVSWNGASAGEALAATPVLWSERPPATREGARLAQARLLTRAPVGASATVAFRNRGAPAVDTRSLVAVAEPLPERPPCMRPADLLAGRTVETRELPAGHAGVSAAGAAGVLSAAGVPAAGASAAGAGYVRIRFELPALRTPEPGSTLRRALARFAADRLPGVVIDVRGNCGGLDRMVAPLVAPFLREAEVYEVPGVYRRDRGVFEPDPRLAITVLPEPPLYRGRIAVLIDGDTLSAGEAIPLLLKGLPDVAVIGFHATQGSFGIGLRAVRLPGGPAVVVPRAQSLDGAGVVEVDGDAAGRGGVEPDHRLPLTEEVVDRWFGQGDDVALDEAVRFVRGEPSRLAPATRAPGF